LGLAAPEAYALNDFQALPSSATNPTSTAATEAALKAVGFLEPAIPMNFDNVIAPSLTKAQYKSAAHRNICNEMAIAFCGFGHAS
jgi:hypothetical protein